MNKQKAMELLGEKSATGMADVLGVSTQTVWNWTAEQELMPRYQRQVLAIAARRALARGDEQQALHLISQIKEGWGYV